MTTPDALRDAEHIADVSNIPYDGQDDTLSDNSQGSGSSHARGIQARAKTVLLDRLLRDFDILIYCQLSVLYYMDCSIFQFAIRAIVQLLFFTPKTGPFPETPNNQSYLVAILVSNASCILLHCLSANPAGEEITRGYIHGGLFIDFIGQKGPISKSQLLVVDIVIAALQIIMLGMIIEKEKTKHSVSPSSDSTATRTAGPAQSQQDHDAEERGVLRTGEHATGNEIELQEFRTANDERDAERGGLLAEISGEPGRYRHPRDIFTSGEAVIMETNILGILRDQWSYTHATSGLRTGSATSRDRARDFLRRRMGIHVRARA
ncbi:hypothetical protein VTO42DRAFT_3443 [Malbranchea cinnamomea]